MTALVTEARARLARLAVWLSHQTVFIDPPSFPIEECICTGTKEGGRGTFSLKLETDGVLEGKAWGLRLYVLLPTGVKSGHRIHLISKVREVWGY